MVDCNRFFICTPSLKKILHSCSLKSFNWKISSCILKSAQEVVVKIFQWANNTACGFCYYDNKILTNSIADWFRHCFFYLRVFSYNLCDREQGEQGEVWDRWEGDDNTVNVIASLKSCCYKVSSWFLAFEQLLHMSGGERLQSTESNPQNSDASVFVELCHFPNQLCDLLPVKGCSPKVHIFHLSGCMLPPVH